MRACSPPVACCLSAHECALRAVRSVRAAKELAGGCATRSWLTSLARCHGAECVLVGDSTIGRMCEQIAAQCNAARFVLRLPIPTVFCMANCSRSSSHVPGFSRATTRAACTCGRTWSADRGDSSVRTIASATGPAGAALHGHLSRLNAAVALAHLLFGHYNCLRRIARAKSWPPGALEVRTGDFRSIRCRLVSHDPFAVATKLLPLVAVIAFDVAGVALVIYPWTQDDRAASAVSAFPTVRVVPNGSSRVAAAIIEYFNDGHRLDFSPRVPANSPRRTSCHCFFCLNRADQFVSRDLQVARHTQVRPVTLADTPRWTRARGAIFYLYEPTRRPITGIRNYFCDGGAGRIPLRRFLSTSSRSVPTARVQCSTSPTPPSPPPLHPPPSSNDLVGQAWSTLGHRGPVLYESDSIVWTRR